jgi:hypothetical protein
MLHFIGMDELINILKSRKHDIIETDENYIVFKKKQYVIPEFDTSSFCYICHIEFPETNETDLSDKICPDCESKHNQSKLLCMICRTEKACYNRSKYIICQSCRDYNPDRTTWPKMTSLQYYDYMNRYYSSPK